MRNTTKVKESIKKKTLVSIGTPLGEGGIGKIIVSGPNALPVVNKMFEGKGITDLCRAASQKLYYGYIHDRGQRIDEVILLVTKQADSFTGEDVVEINCHGGIRVVLRIYEHLQAFGAKGVDWHSLLLQSFENDTLDIIQVEALQEVIRARTKLGTKVLLDQYAGALSDIVKKILAITNENHFDKTHISHTISALARHIYQLLETAPYGMALTAPQSLIILGKPNVGKSTLINTILGEERMLVHNEPGTTRDYVSEFIAVHGIPFEIIDTAGIRDTADKLEFMSIEMTLEQINRADKIMAVFDNSRPFDREDKRIVEILHSWLMKKEPHQERYIHTIIPVINKCDLPAKLDRGMIESEVGQPLCCISAQNRNGLADLQKRLVEEFDTGYRPMRPVVFNKRLYHLMRKADTLVKQGKECLAAGENISDELLRIIRELRDIFTVCLRGHGTSSYRDA